MTDDLVQRHVEQLRMTGGDLADLCQPLADAIEALTAERDAAKAKVEQLGREVNMAKYGQPDFAWSVHLAAMAELQAERDTAYARGYSDAETEISKSALGQKNNFLNAEYANAVHNLKDLNELLEEAQTEWSKYASAWMTAEGKLKDAMDGLEKCQAELDEYSRQEYPLDHTVHERYRQRDYDANPARITLAALKRENQ